MLINTNTMKIENIYYNGILQKTRIPIEVYTSIEMDENLCEENIGIAYKFLGADDDNYRNGIIYIIENIDNIPKYVSKKIGFQIGDGDYVFRHYGFTEDLQDFEYYIDSSNVIHITEWKQTLNGKPSTTCVLPNYPNIYVD